MQTATVIKSNPPKARRTTFGVKNDFFVVFDDGTKAMVDAKYLADFREGNTVMIDAEPSVNGWLNVGKRTPFVVVGARRSITFPFNALRQTPDGWEFDVTVNNERYVGTVDEHRYSNPLLNGLVYLLTATVSGNWIPKSDHYIQHGEMEYEDFWLLEHGTLSFDNSRYARTVASVMGWNKPPNLPDVCTIAGLQDFYKNLRFDFDPDVIVNRILWRNAFERSVVEYLVGRTEPKHTAYSISEGVWRFFVNGCTITTRACIGSSITIEHPELGVYNFKITNDRDAFVTFVEGVCDHHPLRY